MNVPAKFEVRIALPVPEIIAIEVLEARPIRVAAECERNHEVESGT